MAYDNVVARFTLAGSMISCIATFCVLVSYMVYREELRSFRQVLVFNLALAEFLNTLNNSISGGIYIQAEAPNPGPACIANGFVNQLTVQAVDFTIMAIVIVTLLTITRKTYLPNVSLAAKTIICLSTWFVPVITSTTAVGMRAMSPVSGNCWRKQSGGRYQGIGVSATSFGSPLQEAAESRPIRQHARCPTASTTTDGPDHDGAGDSREESGHNSRGVEKEVRRMLLLNAYPTLYVLLWIPDIVNRLMEATGTAPSNTRIVGALQSTSQFVGFANALTFGLSATMRRRIVSAASSSKLVWRRGEV
ncbi:hypothetical protein KVR01_013268 [Diaporthe batatas]|uniref:uncharacterized protein n=1 Tax=Diaporthe batatas TaxID=748121 RepID=UPI001D04949A|nr:uncharacterized protein KVR01_013268 [Diaporthe batatas]KAG8156855.1 hypothetical protein KVR01_013268 [Diaporthe batatas]